MRRFKTWGWLVFAAMVAAPALAADGRIPVYQPYTIISQPGSYYVTQNLAGAGASPVVQIDSPGVDLDLNGFTLSQSAGPAPVVLISGVDRFRIHGGILTGGNRSIDGVPNAGNTTTVEDLTMSAPAAQAIHIVGGTGATIHHVQVVGAGGDAISLTSTQNSRVDESVVHSSGGIGIRLTDVTSTRVLQCTVYSSSGHGISVDTAAGQNNGVLLRDNLIVGSNGEGIHLENLYGGAVWENHVDAATLGGIHLASNVLHVSVRENHVVTSQHDGIRVDGSSNSIERNHLGNNIDYGLRFTSTATLNTFGGNTMTSDGGSVGCTGTAVLSDFCNNGTNNGSFGTNLVPTAPVF